VDTPTLSAILKTPVSSVSGISCPPGLIRSVLDPVGGVVAAWFQECSILLPVWMLVLFILVFI